MNKILSIRVVLTIFLVFFIYSNAYAADPSNINVSGTPSHGSSITISGNNFGTTWGSNISRINDYIESGTSGAPADSWPSGWARADNTWPDVVFDNSQAHSGELSLLQEKESGTYYPYSYPEPYYYGLSNATKVFATFWARWHIGYDAGNHQWKIWRMTPDYNVGDPWPEDTWPTTTGEIMATCWHGNDNWLNVMCKSNQGQDDDCFPYNDASEYGVISDDMGCPTDSWFRIDIFVQHNSAVNAEDGYVEYRFYRPGSSLQEATTANNWETRASPNEGTTFKRFYVQGYFGNSDADEDLAIKVWTDDAYVQTGSMARVEVCNSSQWSTRTGCEVQLPTSWNDTSITISSFNTGGMFSQGNTAYVYVVNDNGEVNASGEPITIGSTGNSSPTITVYTPSSFPDNTSTTPGSWDFLVEDSDGTISGCTWYNDDDSTSGSCTADDGTFDEASEDATASIGYQTGENNIRIVCTDDDSAQRTFNGVVNYSAAGDTTDPLLSNILYDGASAQSPITASIPSGTFSGACGDQGDGNGLRSTNPIVITCPDCDSVGSVTGSTSWSATIAPSASSEDGDDQLLADGTFATSTGWTINPDVWTVSGGSISADGGDNGSFTAYADFESYKNYTVCYEVTSYVEGSLYHSQYGFTGEGQQLPTTVDTHCFDAQCAVDDGLLMIYSVGFNGTIDNISVHEKGSSNTVTIRCYDPSDNYDEEVFEVNYLGSSSNKRLNIGRQIDLGGGILLDF